MFSVFVSEFEDDEDDKLTQRQRKKTSQQRIGTSDRQVVFKTISTFHFLWLVLLGLFVTCAWRLRPNTRNQPKGMLEVLRLAVLIRV